MDITRDVCQNRRNDVFFNPEVKEETIVYFMNLIQLDGYNPMLLMGSRFKIKNVKKFLSLFSKQDRNNLKDLLNKEFTIGEFFNYVDNNKINLPTNKEEFLDILIELSDKIDNVYPHMGFWSDHWHYNIDLLESFSSIYPDKLKELLFDKKIFTFYDNPMVVMPRKEKYVLFNGEPRQINSVYIHPKKQQLIEYRSQSKYTVRTKYGKGEIYKTTLIVKLLTLILNKFSLLDHECIGVEMEADRPNWCDALNGLPGLFGSSTAESLELLRLIKFVKNLLPLHRDNIYIPHEIYELFSNLTKLSNKYIKNGYKNNFEFWDSRHAIVENYRETTLYGISGKEKVISTDEILETLLLFEKIIEYNLPKAIDKRNNIIYTYFENKPIKYKVLNRKNYKGYQCIIPLKFETKPLPYFLEGLVHYYRVLEDKRQIREIHKNVLNSTLFDTELKMLKINAPLKDSDIHIGRIKIFTPGWLENESIWLHMEYKYMLELLKNGLSEEFWKLSKTALVPFMNPQKYGRSIFENSSFIVSSAHPEKNLHGQGFVGRLSGSTAEFLSMWINICCGSSSFYLKDGKLYCKFTPQIPSWLFKEDGSFEFKFLGNIDVEYINPERKNTFGENKANIYKIIL